MKYIDFEHRFYGQKWPMIKGLRSPVIFIVRVIAHDGGDVALFTPPDQVGELHICSEAMDVFKREYVENERERMFVKADPYAGFMHLEELGRMGGTDSYWTVTLVVDLCAGPLLLDIVDGGTIDVPCEVIIPKRLKS